MAINYQDVFGDMGVMIAALDQFVDAAQGNTSALPMPVLKSNIQTQLSGTGRYDVLEGLPTDFDRYRDDMIRFARDLSQRCKKRLLADDVVDELPGTVFDFDLDTIIQEMIRDMLAKGETVKRSVVTLGSVSAVAGNSGNPQVLTTTLLDGVQSPASTAPASIHYLGVNTELCSPSESLTVTCVADEDSSGTLLGQEEWQAEGQRGPGPGQGVHLDNTGSGDTNTFVALPGYAILGNDDFSSWSANVPSGWTIETGAAGVEIFEETGDANIYRGTGSMRMEGTSEIRQAIAQSQIVPNQLYCIAVWVKGESAADGDMTIALESDTVATLSETSEKVIISAATLASNTSFSLYYAFWMAPAAIPADICMSIKYAGTAGTPWVDSLGFGPVTYVSGVGLVVMPGANQSTLNDRFTFSLANTEGVFQRFFRRFFGRQFPSDASPTIADTLATSAETEALGFDDGFDDGFG